MRPIAVVGWVVIVGALFTWQGIGLSCGSEWPVLSDFLRAFTRPTLGRFVLFGVWLWLGWHVFVRDWQLFAR